MSQAEDEFCKKRTRTKKILFWLIAIPVAVGICLVTAPIIPITGCAMGYLVNMIYKDMFR